MWKKIKDWWARVKLWFTKNKKILIAVGASFVAGLATAFGIVGRGNRDIKRHISELEEQLVSYRQLNDKLTELNRAFQSRVESIEYTSDELRRQNAILRDLNEQAGQQIAESRSTIADIRRGLETAQGTTDEISEIGGKLRAESEKLRTGIQRLEDFIAKYGT